MTVADDEAIEANLSDQCRLDSISIVDMTYSQKRQARVDYAVNPELRLIVRLDPLQLQLLNVAVE